MQDDIKTKKRGRPAAFDYEHALEQAMLTFWQYGYEGTSMSTLMASMNMNKTSIYAAYGSKEMLFQKVLERYVSGPASFVMRSLAQPNAQAVIQTFLVQAAHALTGKDHPAGCLVIQGALSCSEEAMPVHEILSQYRQSIEARLKERLDQAKLQQDLAADVDTLTLAKLVMTIHQGMSVQATTGTSHEALKNVAMLAANSLISTHREASSPI